MLLLLGKQPRKIWDIIEKTRYVPARREGFLYGHEEGIMKRLAQILEEMINKDKKFEKLKLFSVKSLWKQVVGDKIASRADVVDFVNGKLIVVCDDPMWKAELQLMKDAIAARMNEALGKKVVKKIVIRRGYDARG